MLFVTNSWSLKFEVCQERRVSTQGTFIEDPYCLLDLKSFELKLNKGNP